MKERKRRSSWGCMNERQSWNNLIQAAKTKGPPYDANKATQRDLLKKLPGQSASHANVNIPSKTKNLLFLQSALQLLAQFGGLVLRNKLGEVLLCDELARALLQERREPSERPHAKYVRGQQRALWIQARLRIRFGAELWAEALEGECDDAQPADAPP
jgi:hypothetical protein